MDISNEGELERTPSEKEDVKSDPSSRLPTPPARSVFKSVLLVVTMTLAMIVNVGHSQDHREGHLAYALGIRFRELRLYP